MVSRQQFKVSNKTVGITTILFKNINAIQDIEKIVFFKEGGLSGNWLKKEFRYSFDNSIWSNWRTLTQNNVSSIDFTAHPSFYIEIIYTRSNYNTADVTDFFLYYDAALSTSEDASTGTIDADTLQGEPGSFYLDRTNHTGSYDDLDINNVTDTSLGDGIGVYDSRIDSSEGSEFLFKRIRGSNGIGVTEDSGIITIDASSVSGGGTYQNPSNTAVGVGGIPDSSSFFASEKTFAETMEAMFFPTLYPTLTNPSNTFSDNVATLQDAGYPVNITFTATFSRGSINPQYTATSPYRSGVGNTVHYTGPGLSDVGSDPSSPNVQSISHTVTVGNQTWTSYWSYDEGVQPYDSIGNAYDSPLGAGSTSSKSTTIEGVYAIYGTTNTIDNPDTKQSLVSMLTGNNVVVSMVPESGGYKQSFDVPNSWTGAPTNRPLLGVETYNTVSSSWEYEGGSASASLTKWTTSFVAHDDAYMRYTYNGVDRSSINIRLKFS